MYINRKKLELYETSKVQKNLLYLKQKFVTRSPHSIHWLKWKLDKVRASRMITALKSKDNKTLHKTKDIIKEFFSFYKSLYSLSKPSEIDISHFFGKDWIWEETF